MPTYEYQCRVCGHQLEAFQKMSDAPLVDCPACRGQTTLQRLVSPVGFQLKGTGWYVTDFRDKGKPLPPATAGKTTKASEPSTEAKTTTITLSETSSKTGTSGEGV